eukprot:m.109093 g.109093  ORF g.109093 m.109093 type:complete len:451 (+) comp15954_c0_seq1:189-1541(+)
MGSCLSSAPDDSAKVNRSLKASAMTRDPALLRRGTACNRDNGGDTGNTDGTDDAKGNTTVTSHTSGGTFRPDDDDDGMLWISDDPPPGPQQLREPERGPEQQPNRGVGLLGKRITPSTTYLQAQTPMTVQVTSDLQAAQEAEAVQAQPAPTSASRAPSPTPPSSPASPTGDKPYATIHRGVELAQAQQHVSHGAIGSPREARRRLPLLRRVFQERKCALVLPSDAGTLEATLAKIAWPSSYPWRARDFRRADEGDDVTFYSQPRLVPWMDAAVRGAVKRHFMRCFPSELSDALDLCSSVASHYPDNYLFRRVVGLGLNAKELDTNPLLTERVVCDLNSSPVLPFKDESFDIVTLSFAFDYLMRPLDVFTEVFRVLRPGGVFVVTYGAKSFPTKVTQLWGQCDETERLVMVASHFVFAAQWEGVAVSDLTPSQPSGVPESVVAVFASKPKV